MGGMGMLMDILKTFLEDAIEARSMLDRNRRWEASDHDLCRQSSPGSKFLNMFAYRLFQSQVLEERRMELMRQTLHHWQSFIWMELMAH